MSAIVTDDRDVDWYTNGRSWSIIRERAERDLDPAQLETFREHVDTVGVMFSLIDEPERRDVARWLLRAVESLDNPEWDDERNRAHLEELAVMLRAMA
jgi:hypothetical protein